jgi:ketosteroid isomerase-like protein
MRRFVLLLVVTALLGTVSSASAQSDPDVEREVIALAKAQWQAAVADRPVAERMKDVAEEYTEFNPDYPTRLDGKALVASMNEAFSSGAGKTLVGNMANPKVQVYGDVAILSYNYVGAAMDSDGAVESVLAKSTRVYAKKDGRWMLVHANFAPLGDDD